MAKRRSPEIITEKQIRTIAERLTAGKPVRRSLPHGGRLHIDRTLPFLVVYRCPHGRSDPGTERLVKGEASYLIAAGKSRPTPDLTRLVKTVIEILSNACGGFLVIEIWSNASQDHKIEGGNKDVVRPGFRIVTMNNRSPTRTVETLQRALGRISIQSKRASVNVETRGKISPYGQQPLLSKKALDQLRSYIIGVEVDPIYQHLDSESVFPIVLKNLHRGIDRALKRAVFEFSRNHTEFDVANYLALGRRAVVKAVWDVDQNLAKISDSFDFLHQVTPINAESAWAEFRRSRFEKTPQFFYRPLPIDPVLLKRQLFQIRIERVEDPTLATLFHDTRIELDRKLTMLGDLEKREFLFGSLQVFGDLDKALVEVATEILKKVPPHGRDEIARVSLNADEFSERARKEIDYYRQQYPEIQSKVSVRSDIVGLMVSRGNLLVGRQTKIPDSRVEALLQHEIGTHIVTYFNGRKQPLRLLYCGLPGYEALQEGLAVLAEFLVGGLSRPRLRLLAGRVIAVMNLIDGASFVENFRNLNQVWGFNQRNAFSVAIRVHRGGGLTKDAVYLQGLIELLEYMKNGGDLTPLFTGKIALGHIPIIRELLYRQVLKPVPLKPHYLEKFEIEAKMDLLRTGLKPIDLIKRR